MSSISGFFSGGWPVCWSRRGEDFEMFGGSKVVMDKVLLIIGKNILDSKVYLILLYDYMIYMMTYYYINYQYISAKNI